MTFFTLRVEVATGPSVKGAGTAQHWFRGGQLWKPLAVGRERVPADRHRQSGGHINRHRWSPGASHQGQDRAKRAWSEVTRREGMALGFWGPETISPGAREPDAGALCHPQHQSPESTKTGRQGGDPGGQGSLRRTSSSSGAASCFSPVRGPWTGPC